LPAAARHVAVNAGTLAHFEAGHRPLRQEALWRSAELLGQDPLETVAEAVAEADEAVIPVRSLAHARKVVRAGFDAGAGRRGWDPGGAPA